MRESLLKILLLVDNYFTTSYIMTTYLFVQHLDDQGRQPPKIVTQLEYFIDSVEALK